MSPYIAGLVAVAASAFATGASAQAYASAAAGRGHIALTCAEPFNCEENDRAHRFIAGHRFAGGLSAELGVIDFGSATFSGAGTTGKYLAAAWTAGVAVDAPLGSWVGFMGRLGVARLKAELHTSNGFSSATTSDNSVAPYVGLGFFVTPWRNIRIEFSVDQSRAELDGDKASVRAVLLGVRTVF